MLVRVASYTTPIEAHLSRGRLEAEGVPAFVCHEQHVGAIWMYSIALGGAKVYVHRNDLARARDIVEAHNRGDFALEDEDPLSCPRCHKQPVVQRRLSWKSALLCAHLVNVPLYFRWATLKCLACGNQWDLPETRTYRLSAIALSVVVATTLCFVVLLLLLSPYCLDGTKYIFIFRQSEACSY